MTCTSPFFSAYCYCFWTFLLLFACRYSPQCKKTKNKTEQFIWCLFTHFKQKWKKKSDWGEHTSEFKQYTKSKYKQNHMYRHNFAFDTKSIDVRPSVRSIVCLYVIKVCLTIGSILSAWTFVYELRSTRIPTEV